MSPTEDDAKLPGRHPKKDGIEKHGEKKESMAGAEEALADNIYQNNDHRSGDKFSRTTEAIVIYVEKKGVGAKVAHSLKDHAEDKFSKIRTE
jgi:hypothetical protein